MMVISTLCYWADLFESDLAANTKYRLTGSETQMVFTLILVNIVPCWVMSSTDFLGHNSSN